MQMKSLIRKISVKGLQTHWVYNMEVKTPIRKDPLVAIGNLHMSIIMTSEKYMLHTPVIEEEFA